MCNVQILKFDNQVLFYIGDKTLIYPTVLDCKSYCVYNVHNDIADLSYIATVPIHRGKGYADKILRYSIKYLKVSKILLDDMSDRPWCKNNLYVKIGFVYKNCYPYPEMVYTRGKSEYIKQ